MLILEERRLKDAQRKKAERQMASEEKKGTNIMIMHDMIQFNPFNTALIFLLCTHSRGTSKRCTA